MQHQQQIVHLGHLCMVRGAALVCAYLFWKRAAPIRGGTGRRRAGVGKAKRLREAELFVYPTKISASRICFSYLP